MRSIYRAASFLALSLAIPCMFHRSTLPVQAASVAAPVAPRFFALLMVPDPVNAAFQAAVPSDGKPAAQQDIPLPEGKGRDLAKKLCGSCHSTNVWAIQRHTDAQWSSIIDSMITKGLEASDADLATVNDYLAASLAPPKKEVAPPPASEPPPAR